MCASGTYIFEGWAVGESSFHKHVFHHLCQIERLWVPLDERHHQQQEGEHDVDADVGNNHPHASAFLEANHDSFDE